MDSDVCGDATGLFCLLASFGAVFAVEHIYITWFNNKPEVGKTSKYAPQWETVSKQSEDAFTLTYAEIEQTMGFPIDHSF